MGSCCSKHDDDTTIPIDPIPIVKDAPLLPPKPDPSPGNQKVYIAKFDYKAVTTDDLSFNADDELVVTNKDEGDWWTATNLKTNQSGYIPSNYVALKDSLDNFGWFHGPIKRAEAEKLITKNFFPGSFLLRESESSPGNYSLSLQDDNHVVKHYRIRMMDNGNFYISTRMSFPSIPELIVHYEKDADGLATTLQYPLIKKRPGPTPPPGPFEIPRDEITLTQKLGQGQFGEVWKGEWKNVVGIAVKTMKKGSMSSDEFLAEAEVMKKLRHPKLVQLYGVCTLEEPVFIIAELMKNGSLLDYLRDNVGAFGQDILVDLGAQVASGMAYLVVKNFIHRDLAARNVLVGDNYNCKVADFGLTRSAEIYTAKEGTKFPVKWTAPEAANRQQFSIFSDVWSFGILLTEIVTFGRVPYPGMNNAEVLKGVSNGYRMPKPHAPPAKECPQELYAIMLQCWNAVPEQRPGFEALQNMLEDLVTTTNYAEAHES